MRFLDKLRVTFPERIFSETTVNKPFAFVHDDGNISMIVEQENEHCFVLKNINQQDLTHICIDGDFIKDKREKYRGENKPYNKPDSIILSEKQILFLEMKMRVQADSQQRNIYKELLDGFDQLENFLEFLKENLSDEVFHGFFKPQRTHFRIGLKATPSESRYKKNQEYKNRKAQFGGKTGWYDIDYSTSFNFTTAD